MYVLENFDEHERYNYYGGLRNRLLNPIFHTDIIGAYMYVSLMNKSRIAKNENLH